MGRLIDVSGLRIDLLQMIGDGHMILSAELSPSDLFLSWPRANSVLVTVHSSRLPRRSEALRPSE